MWWNTHIILPYIVIIFVYLYNISPYLTENCTSKCENIIYIKQIENKNVQDSEFTLKSYKTKSSHRVQTSANNEIIVINGKIRICLYPNDGI